MVVALPPVLGPIAPWAGPRAPRAPVACPHDSAAARAGAPSAAVYCMDLVPSPDLRDASGVAELGRAASPFGVAVTENGEHRYDVTLSLQGLPSPRSLGDYSVYIAWVTTSMLRPTRKLGVVREGANPLGEVDWNTFLVLVSAEASDTVSERRGRIVMRGSSPSSLLHPYDAAMLPSGGREPPPAAHPPSHMMHVAGGWVMPPPHPAAPGMIPGLEALVPSAAPWLPGAGVDIATLPAAVPSRPVALRDGDTLALDARLVRRTIAGRAFAAYGFNGQYPGPLIRVPQNATIVVNFTNHIDQPSAVHWHGVRLDNRSDGVPHLTQEPVPPGGRFRYAVHFPDAGIYWYHPHLREDTQQDLGLYGNLLVSSPRPGFFAPANREEVLMLDDILLGESGPVPYGAERATHALMGRFGNVLLVNGEPGYRLRVRRGEVVRFFLTNASNTRPYNLSFGSGTPVKLVGSDVGKFEREQWVPSVVIAPAERYIVDVRFDRPGTVALTNRVQAIAHAAGAFVPQVDTLGTIEVEDRAAAPDHSASFARLRRNPDVMAEVERFRSAHAARPPDRELTLTLRTTGLPFGLVQMMRLDTAFVNPVEWSGTMPMMDWLSTASEVEWVLREPATGRENMAIAWRFRRGTVLKLRLRNERHTLHPMQHPIHVHGQRFLVLAQNGVPNDNLVWKDTILLPVGATADILLDLSNPGRWMLHCHIAEHLEAGMHAVFTVD